MSSAAVFSNNVIEWDIAAGERSPSAEETPQRPSQAGTDNQATGVTFIDEWKEWLVDAYKRLSRFALLEDDWDSYGAEAPSQVSVDKARGVLSVLADVDFEPTSVDASAEGGVCLSFQQGDRYGDVECFNSGEFLAVTSGGGDATDVWEIKGADQDLRTSLSKIRT
ncbi:MAG: hypothetical protein J3T61_13050, partial [Candidatus Brocadiales bacterium]|nr:hypothetical protein [Candidatus Bathyanammoxibius sp.]